MHRLEKVWVSKLMDKQEEAWQPTAVAGKSGANLLGGANKAVLTGGEKICEKTSKLISRKKGSRAVRERWEQAPKKTAVCGNVGPDSKKFEENNPVRVKGTQSEESRASMGKKTDDLEDASEAENIIQLDGNAEHNVSSDDDDDELGLDDDSDDEDSEGSDESSEDEGENLGDELGSDDDISDEDASKLGLTVTLQKLLVNYCLVCEQVSSLIPPMLWSANMTGSASRGTNGSSI